MAIEGLTPEQILKREIATGEPTIYELGPDGGLERIVELGNAGQEKPVEA
jgi:2,3-bisphosphoglycerate-dependent phosphoglycerate mutase